MRQENSLPHLPNVNRSHQPLVSYINIIIYQQTQIIVYCQVPFKKIPHTIQQELAQCNVMMPFDSMKVELLRFFFFKSI